MPGPEVSEEPFRILVVDDESAIREFMAIAFSDEGYAVETADCAEEALKIMASKPIHTVFTDIRMPGMSGVELLEKIRATWVETEVVVMTSYATVESAVTAIRQGAYDYLLKPVEDVEVLLALARRVKDKRDLIDELRRKNAILARLAAEIAALQDWSRRLALSLDAQVLHRTAVEGLWTLSGGGATALYVAEPRARMTLVAATPAPPREAPPLPFTLLDGPHGKEGFGDINEWSALRQELAHRHGVGPAVIYPLLVGGDPYGFLVRFQPLPDAHQRNAAAAGTIAQFVSAVSTALGNALLYRNMAEATLKDGLTGLYNHRYFQERLASEVARGQRTGKPVSLLFFDIDHFKHLNDTQGHPVGDRILTGVAEILRNSSRVSDVPAKSTQTDVAARYGGEEFVLILPDTTREDAMAKGERLRLAIETYPFPGRETQPFGKITASCGVAEYPRDAADAARLIEAADGALYMAKRAGRNRVVAANASPAAAAL